MSDLPPGFVLDQQPGALPPGFELDKKPFLQRAGRYVQGLADQAANGLLLGYGDEVGAAADAALQPLGMQMGPQSQAATYGQRYDENLANTRARMKEFSGENPGASTAANVVGNVAGISQLPLKALGTGGLVAQVGKNAGAGAILGGIQGFGEGEGAFDARVRNSVFPALVGGAVGAGAPIVGKGLGMAYDYLAPKFMRGVAAVADKVTPTILPKSVSAAAPDGGQPLTRDSLAATIADNSRNVATNMEGNAAASRLATEMARDGKGVAGARETLSDLGPAGMLADASPMTQRLATTGYIMPGNAPGVYDTALNARNLTAPSRMVEAFEGGNKPPSIYEANKFLEANKRAIGARAYGDASDAGLKQTPELMALYENPIVKRALDKVMSEEKNTRIGTPRDPASLVDIMHKVKQEIQDMGVAETGRGSSTQSYFRDLAGHFVDTFKGANPAVAAADRAYRGAAVLPERLEEGQKFLRTGIGEDATSFSPSALADRIPGMSPEEKMALGVGAVNTARDTAAKGPQAARSLAKAIAESDPNIGLQARLPHILPEQAPGIINASKAEGVFAKTDRAIRGGSDTAKKAIGLADEVLLPEGGAPVSAIGLVRKLAEAYNKGRQPSEAVRGRIAEMLTSTDPAANAETLSLIEAMLRRQATARSFTPGLSGAAGGSASTP